MNEHVDDPAHVVAHDPHVATAWTDDQVLTLGYRNGATWSVRLGDIGLDFGPAAEWYHEADGLAFPMSGGAVLLNATTVPRLAGMRAWIVEQTADRDDPPTMADLVGTFAGTI